ncbi:hypothetical protein [Poseidonibacter lekithochrous]|uniref:hypothetical protein n=1 Tax=Poseidonibacter lekithochrous TaxID=1904463 RepID=UPI0008FC5231|nr:hypothetical protein [Poseidonibacter lekithochrous]QKJ21955.1 hypothetical protein ALEK_0652 [Poseidonibacter lekithochrous]
MTINPINMNSYNFNNYVQKTKSENMEEKIEEPKEIFKEREISKEEAILLMYQYKSTQTMKEQIDIYYESQNETQIEEIELQEIRDMNKLLNRAELLKHYDEQNRLSKVDEKELELELWA